MRPSFSNSKMKRKLDLDYVSEWVFLCCWGSDPGSCMTEGHALPWSHTITSDSVHTPPAWYRESRKVLILNRSFLSPLNSLPLSLFLPTTISRTYILRHVQALVPLLQKISHHRSDPVVQTWGMSCGQPCMLACQQVHHWSSPRLWRAKLYPGVMPFRPKSEAGYRRIFISPTMSRKMVEEETMPSLSLSRLSVNGSKVLLVFSVPCTCQSVSVESFSFCSWDSIQEGFYVTPPAPKNYLFSQKHFLQLLLKIDWLANLGTVYSCSLSLLITLVLVRSVKNTERIC